MAAREDFQGVYERLREMLEPYSESLVMAENGPTSYVLNTKEVEKYKKELLFGSAVVKKNYVSYYLFPVYIFPDLLEGISPGLKRRMQGKSCFNFTKVQEEEMNELQQLTERGYERYRQEAFI